MRCFRCSIACLPLHLSMVHKKYFMTKFWFLRMLTKLEPTPKILKVLPNLSSYSLTQIRTETHTPQEYKRLISYIFLILTRTGCVCLCTALFTMWTEFGLIWCHNRPSLYYTGEWVQQRQLWLDAIIRWMTCLERSVFAYLTKTTQKHSHA